MNGLYRQTAEEDKVVYLIELDWPFQSTANDTRLAVVIDAVVDLSRWIAEKERP